MRQGSNHFENERKTLIFAFLLLAIVCFPLSCGCTSKVSNIDVSSVNEPTHKSRIVSQSFKSIHMGINVPFMVYLPMGYEGRDEYPVWYGLHGYSSCETMWLDTALVGRTADEMIERGEIEPLIMVFPLTRYDSAKVIQEDMKDGKRDASQMEMFLCKELVPYIDTQYKTIHSPEGRYIGGFSMGGYFALEIAFRHPDLFGKVGGYSPALLYSDFSGRQLERWIYPNNNAEETYMAADVAKDMALNRLQVYLDCGSVNEPFSAGAQSLYDALIERGISVEFHKHDGGHTLQLGKMGEYLLFYCDGENSR